MSFARAAVRNAAVGVAIADQPEHLSAFLRPGVAAAIWHRQSTPDFQTWVTALDPAQLPTGRAVMRPGTVRSAMADFCNIARTPPCAQRDQLIDDAAALAHMFAALMKSPYLRLRLQAVNTNACRKFHIDALTARLVCTYRGTGTQYVISTNGQDPNRVFTVPTSAPILLRGTLWPETPASGLLHRSPPIAQTGETRLVLVLDPIFDLEDAD